jgi:hypothetical protein
MQQILMAVLMCFFLAGCAQPQLEQPKANGTYLVIENDQAWAVLIDDGRRIERQGRVVDVIKQPSVHSSVASSYVVELPGCGRVQWLSERSDAADGSTSRMSLHNKSEMLASRSCMIAGSISRVWTVLDYSG